MRMLSGLVPRCFRFVLMMVGFSLVTAFVLLAAVPEITKLGTVAGSVAVALFVAMYDFGFFSGELEI